MSRNEEGPARLPDGEAGKRTGVRTFRNRNQIREAQPPQRSFNDDLEPSNQDLEQAHNELGAMRGLYQRLYDFAPIGYVTLNSAGMIADANLAASIMLGYDRDRLRGRILGSFVRPGDSTRFRSHFTAVLKDSALHRCEVGLINTGGSGLDVRLETISCGAPGPDWRCQTAIIDLTERNRAEEARRRGEAELRRATEELGLVNRKEDEFLAMLAHELRNPISAIDSAIRLMATPANADTHVRAREIAQRQLKNVSRILDDLLNVSRITRGALELRKSQIEVQPIIDSAVESVRHMAEKRRHRIRILGSAEALYVDGDKIRLEECLVNLLTNAIKYTPPGGLIEVNAGQAGNNVIMRVKDNGVGIAREELPFIFKLFNQVHPTIDRQEGGLGVGLTVVQRLVQLHGGTVLAQSDGLGKGCCFSISLPLTRKTEKPAAAASRPTLRTMAPVRRILLVEDNYDAAQTVKMLLELSGYETRIACDGATALDLLIEFMADAILMDIGLPGMDGYELCRKLRKIPEHKDRLIIAMSGYGQEEDREQSSAAGFDAHLIKPVEYDRLLALLSAGGPETGNDGYSEEPPAEVIQLYP